jgi:hypothetical protein
MSIWRRNGIRMRINSGILRSIRKILSCGLKKPINVVIEITKCLTFRLELIFDEKYSMRKLIEVMFVTKISIRCLIKITR